MPVLEATGVDYTPSATSLPEGTGVNDEVWVIEATQEVFASYPAFLEKRRLYASRAWACRLSGRGGLTYAQAAEAEAAARASLAGFPADLADAVLRAAHHAVARPDALVARLAESLACLKDAGGGERVARPLLRAFLVHNTRQLAPPDARGDSDRIFAARPQDAARLGLPQDVPAAAWEAAAASAAAAAAAAEQAAAAAAAEATAKKKPAPKKRPSEAAGAEAPAAAAAKKAKTSAKAPAAADGGAGADADKKAKRRKDPDAPKQPKSAFMFFSASARDAVKADNPGIAFGEVGKLLGAKWKELDAGGRAPFEAQAAADKARYEAAMAEYKAKQAAAGGGGDAAGPSSAAGAAPPAKKKKAASGAKKGDAPAGPAPPKGPVKAAELYFRSARGAAREARPGVSDAELRKALAEAWKALPDAERAPFFYAAAEDKKRADREMAEFLAAHPAAAAAAAEKAAAAAAAKAEAKAAKAAAKAAAPGKEKKAAKAAAAAKKKGKAPAAGPAPPRRPAQAFVFFSRAERAGVRAAHPEAKDADVKKLLAEAWKGTAPEARAPFLEAAAADKARYERELAEHLAAGGAPPSPRPAKPAKAKAAGAGPSSPAGPPLVAKPLAEVEAQYAAGSLRAAVVAALVGAAPRGRGLTAGEVVAAAKAAGRAVDDDEKAARSVAHYLANDPNFVRLAKGSYSLHALHPELVVYARPEKKRKADGEGGAEKKKRRVLVEDEPEAPAPEGESEVAAAERLLGRARRAAARWRAALEAAEAARAEAKAAAAAAAKSPGAKAARARRDSDVHVPPEELARFEVPPGKRDYAGDPDDRKAMLEFRQALQARVRELEAAKKAFLDERRRAAEEGAKAAAGAPGGGKAEEKALRRAEGDLAAARRGAESAEKAVADAEKRLRKATRRAEKAAAKEAERGERERRREEAAAAKKYPIDEDALAAELAAAGAQRPGVAPPAWLPPAEGGRLGAQLFVADLLCQFSRPLGCRPLPLPELQRALAAAEGWRARGARGGARAAADAEAEADALGALHGAYQRLVAVVLADVRAAGDASPAERRWAALAGGAPAAWPEVLRRLVLSRAREANPAEPWRRPGERAALAAAALGWAGAGDALTQDQHLALLTFLAEEALEGGRMRAALQRREDAADEARRDARGDMAEERRRLKELHEAEKEARRRRREEERARAEAEAEAEERAAAAAAADADADANAGAAAAAGAAEPSFELPPELREYGGDPDDKKALLTWRQRAQAERRRLDKERAHWVAEQLRAQRAADAAAREKEREEVARAAEREAAEEALARAAEELEERMERLALRRAPVGLDRDHRRYWAGLAQHRAAVFVEEDEAAGAAGGAGGAARWGTYEGLAAVDALLGSLDRRGAREAALAAALEKARDGVAAAEARAEREAAAAEKRARAAGKAAARPPPAVAARTTGRERRQVEHYNPAAAEAASRPAAAAAAAGPLDALMGASEQAALKAAAKAAASLARGADDARLEPPAGAASWRAFWQRAEGLAAGDAPAGGAATAEALRKALQAALVELEAALFAASEPPLDAADGSDDDDDSGAASDDGGGGEGSGAGASRASTPGPGPGADVVDELFSPSKAPRESATLWRARAERDGWAADLAGAATCAHVAYAAGVLELQARPLLAHVGRAAQRSKLRAPPPAPAGAGKRDKGKAAAAAPAPAPAPRERPPPRKRGASPPPPPARDDVRTTRARAR